MSPGERENENRGVRRGSLAFYLVVLAWTIYLLFEASGWSAFEDWVFPLLVGGPLVILLLIQLAKELNLGIVPAAAPGEQADSEESFVDEVTESAADTEPTVAADPSISGPLAVLWIAGSGVAIYLFGFVIALPLFVFLFAWYLEGSVTGAVLDTVVFSALSYVLFVLILDAFLWPGVLLN